MKALDLEKNHSWNEVMDRARKAEAQYLAAGEKGSRKILRTLSSYAQAGEPLTRLIPNGTYTSVLAGGLKLVFDVSQAYWSHALD